MLLKIFTKVIPNKYISLFFTLICLVIVISLCKFLFYNKDRAYYLLRQINLHPPTLARMTLKDDDNNENYKFNKKELNKLKKLFSYSRSHSLFCLTNEYYMSKPVFVVKIFNSAGAFSILYVGKRLFIGTFTNKLRFENKKLEHFFKEIFIKNFKKEAASWEYIDIQ